jgi:hypothetical protein
MTKPTAAVGQRTAAARTPAPTAVASPTPVYVKKKKKSKDGESPGKESKKKRTKDGEKPRKKKSPAANQPVGVHPPSAINQGRGTVLHFLKRFFVLEECCWIHACCLELKGTSPTQQWFGANL